MRMCMAYMRVCVCAHMRMCINMAHVHRTCMAHVRMCVCAYVRICVYGVYASVYVHNITKYNNSDD